VPVFIGSSPIGAHIVATFYVTLILKKMTFGPNKVGLSPLTDNIKLTNHALVLMDFISILIFLNNSDLVGKIVINRYFFIQYNKLFLLSSTTILFITHHKLLQDRVTISQGILINKAKSSA
jgi:hypothetical protein